MTGRLRARWVMLSLRERGLIAIMLGLLAVTIIWFGLIRPVQDGLSRAQADHIIAVDRAGRIAASVTALKTATGGPPQLDGAIDQVVSRSASDAGFTLDSANLEGADRMSIAIGVARPAALFGWLASLEARGIGVEAIIVDPATGGTVSARATLRVAR